MYCFTAIPRSVLQFPARIDWNVGEFDRMEMRDAQHLDEVEEVHMLSDDASYISDNVSTISSIMNLQKC